MYLIIITNNSDTVMRCKNFKKIVLHGTCVLEFIYYDGFPRILALFEYFKLKKACNCQQGETYKVAKLDWRYLDDKNLQDTQLAASQNS